MSLPAGVLYSSHYHYMHTHKACPETSPTVLFVRNLLYNSFNTLIGQPDGYITHHIFLHNRHKLQKPGVSDKSTYPSLYECEFCTHSHSSTGLSSLPNLFSHRGNLWELDRSGNLRQQDLGWLVDGKEQSISILRLLPVFSHWCGHALPYARRISSTFCELNSPEILLQGFKGLNVHIRDNGLTMWHTAYQNHPFCIPQHGHDSLLKR
jgi:hypothetical protein